MKESSKAATISGGGEWVHVSRHDPTLSYQTTFDANHPQIKQDVLQLISQYLTSEGYTSTAQLLEDETNLQMAANAKVKKKMQKTAEAIMNGDWTNVAHSISNPGFLYAIRKQQYFELISSDNRDQSKCLTFLMTQLKPMERISNLSSPNEFKELCYLLTCSYVNEAPIFAQWEGVMKTRERLVAQLEKLLKLELLTTVNMSNMKTHKHALSDNRLVDLLHQAVAYQMEFSRYHPKTTPKVTSILRDFEADILPNAVKNTYAGHTENVKCVSFLGRSGDYLASGSSDNTIRIWDVEPSIYSKENSKDGGVVSRGCHVLRGHKSRVWDLASTADGSRLFSASGDKTVKIWNVGGLRAKSDIAGMNTNLLENNTDKNEVVQVVDAKRCLSTLTGHKGDVYSVSVDPMESHVVTSGYDQTVRLFDIETGSLTKTFRGHGAAVCDTVFNSHGNLCISGSKDGSIRFWDLVSGLNVRTIHQTLGEITSLQLTQNGFFLLSGSKNNSNRLWDLRMLSRSHLTQFNVNYLSTDSNTPDSSSAAIEQSAIDIKNDLLPSSSVEPISITGKNTIASGASSIGTGGGSNISVSNGAGNKITTSLKNLKEKPIARYKGNQNTAKNFVRCGLGPHESFVVGGSEDGLVYLWDLNTGKLLDKLRGHSGVAYVAKWHERQTLLVSCSHDTTVKTWWLQ